MKKNDIQYKDYQPTPSKTPIYTSPLKTTLPSTEKIYTEAFIKTHHIKKEYDIIDDDNDDMKIQEDIEIEIKIETVYELLDNRRNEFDLLKFLELYDTKPKLIAANYLSIEVSK